PTKKVERKRGANLVSTFIAVRGPALGKCLFQRRIHRQPLSCSCRRPRRSSAFDGRQIGGRVERESGNSGGNFRSTGPQLVRAGGDPAPSFCPNGFYLGLRPAPPLPPRFVPIPE